MENALAVLDLSFTGVAALALKGWGSLLRTGNHEAAGFAGGYFV
jgi:hypothetical protein